MKSTTVNDCGGTPSTGPMASEIRAKNRLKICEYIDACFRCSCSECDVGFVDRESGNILCCNQHMFAPDEITAAKRKEPVLVVRYAR